MRSFYTTALILGLAAPALAQTDESSRTPSYLASLDSIMGEIVALLATVLLFDFGTGLPLIVAVLAIIMALYRRRRYNQQVTQG